jgi:hypothetical protein
MNLDANNALATEIENEEKEPKQLTSMDRNDNDKDNSERLPQLRSFSYYDVSVFVLLIQVFSRI